MQRYTTRPNSPGGIRHSGPRPTLTRQPRPQHRGQQDKGKQPGAGPSGATSRQRQR